MAELTQKRGRVKAALTRIETSINSKPDMTAAEAQVRLGKLEECWREFETIQAEIEEDEPAQNVAAFRTANETERQQFEERFYGLAGRMQQKIEERREQQEQRLRANQNQNNGQNLEANPIRLEAVHRNKPRLPEMKLKEFDGDFTNWIFFKNSFEITIDGDNDLLPIQKHQYLIGVLKGEALKVIEGFSINGENYENAWKLLKDTYDNERVIIETHLDALLTFPPVTKEDKAESLKKLVWHIQTHTQSLKTLSQPVDQWDTLIIHMARRGLDYTEQKEWQDKIKDKTPTNMPKLSEFIAFLTEKSHMLRLLNQSNKEIPSDTTVGTILPKGKRGRNNVALGLTASTCNYCSGEHPIFRCEEFLKLSQKERKQQVIEKKLCLNCLKHGHMARDCTSSSCRKCNGKHNSLLHAESTQQPDNKDNNSRATVNYCTEKDNTDAAVSLYCMNKPLSQVILSTAQVYVHGKGQQRVKCRVLLDPGSQINLITQKLVKKLNLPCSQVDKTVSGINQAVINASKSVTITIESIHKKFSSEITCTILSSITERLPQTRLDIEKIQQPTDVVLADPGYSEPGEIELLIGAGLYWKIIIGAPQNLHDGQPTWQNTKLGWICGGELTGTKAGSTATCCKVTNVQLHHQLERFWKQEAIPEEKHYSKEEQAVEKYFQETTQQNAEGRFIVKLPLKSDVTLGHSKYQAERRLQAIERRFSRDPALKTAYTEFLRDYSAQNHMDLVEDVEAVEATEHYYIPHQPVVRPDSITTKVRVVFDASARTDSGNSLNDKLSPGPNLQGDLLQIIIKFRTHEIVITGDVAQMYRQIQVHPEHQRYQLILWRNNDNENVKTYKLNTVTYGTASAPFHALRTVKELAIKFKEKYPLGAKVLEEDLYMDDALSGGSTVAYVKETQKQLAEILLEGQLVMRKWRSNSSKVLQQLEPQHKQEELMIIDKEEAIKTLGLLWNSQQDSLQYQVNTTEDTGNTKRAILSKVSQIFDPLGLISPILIVGKIYMQKLWLNEMDWDEPLNPDYLTSWNQYYLSLPKLQNLIIPRNVNPGNLTETIDIFGFADASEKAYGACVYVVSKNENKTKSSQLLCSKSKVSPLKTISLPRLELEAALLLTNLYQTVKSALKSKIDKVMLWSDSTIVLGWINTEPNLLKTFVANRVAKIQAASEDVTWQHVSTVDNPADIISRGTSVDNLQNNKLWWHGPSWIITAKGCPEVMEQPEAELPEMKAPSVMLATTNSPQFYEKISSFDKLCRIVAYCHRFVNNCRRTISGTKRIGVLNRDELEKAERSISKLIQSECFHHEQLCLKLNRELPKKSPIKTLSPFMDMNGIIRVGGRLANAEMSYNQKHPVVIPARHFLSTLILKGEHERLLHCPPEQLLQSVRQRYWPIGGRREAQKIVRQCLKCFRFQPVIPEVLMGNLPRERVTAVQRPFIETGVDYAGPIQIRESRRRGRIHVSKGYVVVFTCMSTKAVHLELVSDLTTEAFISTLRRFTSRRGICAHMYSDNGTTFVGADHELTEVFEFLRKNCEEISEYLIKQRVDWHFIPPRAAHFGGLWEAAVKMMKRHLNTLTQGRTQTFEEYTTLLTQIEAIMNSRPLTPVINDPNAFNILTPAHFLIGDSLTQPVQHSLTEISENRLSRWQQIQKLHQRFWDRWRIEYLQELQKRTKWCTPGQPIELDTLVLVVEENVPPLHWPLGRIVEVHPGRDGVVRVVTIRTQKGIYKRAVKKICPLPIVKEND